jgi:hypothetical protein
VAAGKNALARTISFAAVAERALIAIVKKTFRLRKVFLLQPLMPPSL